MMKRSLVLIIAFCLLICSACSGEADDPILSREKDWSYFEECSALATPDSVLKPVSELERRSPSATMSIYVYDFGTVEEDAKSYFSKYVDAMSGIEGLTFDKDVGAKLLKTAWGVTLQDTVADYGVSYNDKGKAAMILALGTQGIYQLLVMIISN